MCHWDRHAPSVGSFGFAAVGATRGSQSDELGLNYVREEEVAAIPVIERQSRHVVYGPLADFALDPEVILLFVDVRQGLILSEWNEDRHVQPTDSEPLPVGPAAIPHRPRSR